MSGENPEGAQEAAQKAPKDLDQAAKDKARVTREANEPGSKIDDTPLPDELSTRKRPEVKVKPGQIDLNDKAGFRAFNQHILDLAKKNMSDKKSYGKVSEITVDNTSFILAKDNKDRAYVQVCVIDQADNAIIEQDVPVEIEDRDGEIVYNMPPLTDTDVDTIDPEVQKLA